MGFEVELCAHCLRPRPCTQDALVMRDTLLALVCCSSNDCARFVRAAFEHFWPQAATTVQSNLPAQRRDCIESGVYIYTCEGCLDTVSLVPLHLVRHTAQQVSSYYCKQAVIAFGLRIHCSTRPLKDRHKCWCTGIKSRIAVVFMSAHAARLANSETQQLRLQS